MNKEDEMTLCIKCKVEKRIEDFPAAAFKYYRYVCRECEKIITRNRREKTARICPICLQSFLTYGPQKGCSIQCRIKACSSENEKGCWVWNLSYIGKYPKIRVDMKNILAHRVSFESFIGKINDRDVIQHKCKNLSCVNPHHLKKISKHNFNKKKMEDTQVGEDNYYAKLEEADVSEIRKLRKDGYLYREIAEMYEISQSHASGICRGIFWKHSYKSALENSQK